MGCARAATLPGVARIYLFADETGNFDFSRKQGASRYFGVGTVVLDGDATDMLRAGLLRLRTDLAWKRLGLDTTFHATTDAQAVRDFTFPLLAAQDMRVDVTLLEKSKAQPQVRASEAMFYRYAWFYHLKYLLPKICGKRDELMVIASELGTTKRRAAFRGAVENVVAQCGWYLGSSRVAFWPAKSDPGLWAADYCLWAVSRKWETGDARSHALIAHLVKSEFDLFDTGSKHFY